MNYRLNKMFMKRKIMDGYNQDVAKSELCQAIEKKDVAGIEKILNKNFKKDKSDNWWIQNNGSLLFPSDYNVDVEFEKIKTELLLSFGSDINILDSYDKTNILFKTQNMELLKFYIEKGADIHHVSKWNKNNLLFNPLNTLEKFNFLIDAGVDINHRNHLGDCFLNNLLREDLLEPLIKKIDFSLLKDACFQNGNLLTECNDLQNLQVLIDNGCNIDLNVYGADNPASFSNALANAVFSKKTEKVELLLRNGASPNLYQANGERLNLIGCERMDLAISCDKEIIEKLIQYGLNIKEEEFYQKVFLNPGNPVRAIPEFQDICNIYAREIAKEETAMLLKSLDDANKEDLKIKKRI